MDNAATILSLLENGALEMEGLIPWGSNYTFLVRICQADGEVDAIYKPSKGERPLWDFAQGTLCQRERAAYLVSAALNWHQVPPTILREGPHGRGSVQFFIEHDPEIHYLTFEGQFSEQLQKIVLFDILINNADRKSGHVLLDNDKRLWAIDHGVSFHTDYKLRSVIWEFAGQPIPPPLLEDLRTFQTTLARRDDFYTDQLSSLLTRREMAALQRRLRQSIDRGTFPQPGPGRHYPWPLV